MGKAPAGPVPVVVMGLGFIGQEIVKSALESPELELIGAVDSNPQLVGRKLGEVVGVPALSQKIAPDLAGALKRAKRAVLLPVSAPFHSPLMEPAGRAMEQALGQTGIAAPAVPVYANVTAAPVSDPNEIRRLLIEQVTGMVRWRESVAAMAAAGVTHFIEFGGKVLSPMVKRIAPEAQTTSVVTMEDIEALAKEL